MSRGAGHDENRRSGHVVRARLTASFRPSAASLFFALLAAAALLAPPVAPALADDGSVYVTGGAVHPMINNDIRMEAETVQVVCFGRFAEYRAEFHFVNSGEPQTVLLGFPYVDSTPHLEGPPSLVAFRAWLDGEPLAVTQGTGEDPAWPGSEITYYLHEAVFPRGDTVVVVGYLAEVSSQAAGRFSPDAPALLGPWGVSAGYDYWLHSGAGWSGSIGKAVIRFDLADDFAGWAVDVKAADTKGYEEATLTTRPESYVKLDDRTFQWVFEDLEPELDDDITLAFTMDQRRWDDQLSLAWADDGMTAIDGSGRVSNGVSSPAGWEAFDGRPKSSWGAPAPGVGAWTTVTFRDTRTLREIRILPGKNDQLDAFRRHGRPKTLRVTCSDGTDTVFQLADEPALQRFPISADATWVRFDTLAVYPGTAGNDSYISEIGFGGEPAPRFETFSVLIAETAPPASEPPLVSSTTAARPTTTSDSLEPPVSAATTSSAARSASGSHRGWLWSAYLAIAVAVAALIAVVALEWRTRRRERR